MIYMKKNINSRDHQLQSNSLSVFDYGDNILVIKSKND